MTDVNVEQTSFLDRRVDIREMKPGDEIDQVFAVRTATKREKNDGKPYMVFVLGDKSGQCEAVAWEEFDRLSKIEANSLLRAQGTFEVHEKYGPRLKVRIRDQMVLMRTAKDGEYNLDDLMRRSPVPLETLEKNLQVLIKSVKDPAYKALLDHVFGGERLKQFNEAPAAKRIHQAYRHGLLEHTTTVAHGVSLMATVFGRDLDRDLAVTGALLHDIGKLDVYSATPFSVDMTTMGMLHGEIPVTYYNLRRWTEHLEGFPEGKMLALLHIVASHHGVPEHGASAVPATREAILVHMVDNLGGKLGSFDRVENEMVAGEEWSEFDRALGTRIWMGTNGNDQESGKPMEEEAV